MRPIGEVIRELRKEQNLSQGELCDLIKISATSLSQIENNIKRPHYSTLEKIALALKTTASVIYIFQLERTDIQKNKRMAFDIIFPAFKKTIVNT